MDPIFIKNFRQDLQDCQEFVDHFPEENGQNPSPSAREQFLLISENLIETLTKGYMP
jgi:hypothetical protein